MVSIESIVYLQRAGLEPAPVAALPATSAAVERRRLLLVRGIGRDEKTRPPLPSQQGADGWRPPTEDLIAGMYGYRIPLAFAVSNGPAGLNVRLGVWSSRPGAGAERLEERCAILASVLRGLYPAITVERTLSEAQLWPRAGIALGVPSLKGPVPGDAAVPLDRMVRALAGERWAFLVLAHPAPEQRIVVAAGDVLNELRAAESAAKSEGAPSPLTEQYVGLLKAALMSLVQGGAVGAWRTAVYLLGDGDSYPRLASIWRSVFSGARSLPEPVRVFDRAEAADLALDWSMPNQPGTEGPGLYSRPFELQTLLTSTQLAAYVHLPQLETPGFSVELVPAFDTVTASTGEPDAITAGRVVHQGRETSSDYRVPLQALTRHVFVSGVTGAGKTNTVFHLLGQLVGRVPPVPFLVIEPAKTEYRALLGHPRLAEGLLVLTPGDETVAPLRVNPFEPLPGTPISVHVDLLRALFTASFGMWSPLPQILERSLHLIYQDRGWNITANTNRRVDAGIGRAMAFPTLSDLYNKVEEVIGGLGYESEVTSNMRAALSTRIDGLRVGGKGRMLDTQRSTPTEALFARPAVLELERMGDDDDKVFVMGLMLIRLAEHRRAHGSSGRLEHLLVIEEAHRLLASPGPRGEPAEDHAAAKAIQAFVDLLAEVRAYGQGVLVADQVPVRLAPEVIKNTNLKVTHRLVAGDDRAAVGATMAMDERQLRALATLRQGEAALFSEGDDSPVLVKVPEVKRTQAPPDEEVRRRAAAVAPTSGLCTDHCIGTEASCEEARRLSEMPQVRQVFGRLVLSMAEDLSALDRLWQGLLDVVGPALSLWSGDTTPVIRCLLLRSTDALAERRGAQAGWTYGATARFADGLRMALLARLVDVDQASTALAFQAITRGLHARPRDPFPLCGRICAQDPPVCLYRFAAADALMRDAAESWRAVDDDSTLTAEERPQRHWWAATTAAQRFVQFPDDRLPEEERARVAEAARRASLCLAQQAVFGRAQVEPQAARDEVERLIEEAWR